MDFPIPLQNHFFEHMPGFYELAEPAMFENPSLVAFNEQLADTLNIDSRRVGEWGARVFSGQWKTASSKTLAFVYAGHQFGHFNPRLGDGRAHLLGEVVGQDKRMYDLQLKGSGPTVFSRGGDGKAAIKPALREYLIAEFMYAMGIPTTRMLAVVSTGEPVFRETPLPGAVVTRVARSHIRVGTFEYFAAKRDLLSVRKLTEYIIERDFPELRETEQKIVAFARAVMERQANLIAQWMQVGFIHGVMNTDNTSISGETIDYGPCAFMDQYDPGTVFSSIDTMGRYAYQNQPKIAQWNLARFLETLLMAYGPSGRIDMEMANNLLEEFTSLFEEHFLSLFARKIGIDKPSNEDATLIKELLDLMDSEKSDFTDTFRNLAGMLTGAISVSTSDNELRNWFERWQSRLSEEGPLVEIAQKMNRVNPLYVPRNDRVEKALEDAQGGDLSMYNRLLEALRAPFEKRAGFEAFRGPATAQFNECYKTFCGT